MNPGNYLKKFIEDWEGMRDSIKPDMSEAYRATMEMIRGVDETASHWVLSPEAFDFVWNTDVCGRDLEGVRLPYKNMVVEYVFDYEALGFDPVAVEGDRDVARHRFFVLGEVDDSLILLSGFKLEKWRDSDIPAWVMSPCGLNVSYEALANLDKWMTRVENGFDVKLGGSGDMHCRVIPSLPIFKDRYDLMTGDQLKSSGADLFDEFRLALGLLAVLSCNNVPTGEIPPPEKLNRKRVKAGKSPLPSYRTLHITSHESRQRHDAGTHASPRTHWRRGHIRNQPTAKGIVRKWIKPTIICAGGDIPELPEIVLT